MRVRERQKIFRLIETKIAEGRDVSYIVTGLVNHFDISVATAEDAVHQWMEQFEQDVQRMKQKRAA